MKKMTYILSILILSLYGCDYSIQLKGRVFSNANGEPICGAQVILKSVNFIAETDSLGFFHLWHTGGGRVPKPIYLIKKDGYKDFEIEFKFSDSKHIYLVKEEKKNYDFGEKFFYPNSTNLRTHITNFTIEKYSNDFAMRGDSLIIYLDIDDIDIEFENFLKRHQNGGWNNDRYVIKN
jgi:hypothetical protein